MLVETNNAHTIKIFAVLLEVKVMYSSQMEQNYLYHCIKFWCDFKVYTKTKFW